MTAGKFDEDGDDDIAAISTLRSVLHYTTDKATWDQIPPLALIWGSISGCSPIRNTDVKLFRALCLDALITTSPTDHIGNYWFFAPELGGNFYIHPERTGYTFDPENSETIILPFVNNPYVFDCTQ